MAADAKSFKFADEPGILGAGLLFIRQLGVAVEAFVFYDLLLGIQLQVGVIHPVAVNVVASIADGEFGFIRCAAQEFFIL